ncbi:MAG: helix-turn-helix domain-containing protein [Desulfobacteraceae bacterium]|nr:MAG: helix-turn-helix domain-containing protein [Desulfobacteraceae bacterium]
MGEMLSTKEVARFLNVNEKMVYSLIAEKGLPASKVTGKWLFPLDLVKQWIETATENYPQSATDLPPYHGLILIAGSNDLLLDNLISFFNQKYEDHLAMFGFTGSMGGLKALRRNLCHIASSHLVADNEDYNFPFLNGQESALPAVVNFCQREQGLIVEKGNPWNIKSVKDLLNKDIRIVNRPLGTGTRALFDRELKRAGIDKDQIQGHANSVTKHLDIGLEILGGKASAGPGIKPVARQLGLDFIPICMERFDFLVSKDRFFDQGIQLFLGLLKESYFTEQARQLGGYDLSLSGDIVYPQAQSGPESSLPE